MVERYSGAAVNELQRRGVPGIVGRAQVPPRANRWSRAWGAVERNGLGRRDISRRGLERHRWLRTRRRLRAHGRSAPGHPFAIAHYLRHGRTAPVSEAGKLFAHFRGARTPLSTGVDHPRHQVSERCGNPPSFRLERR